MSISPFYSHKNVTKNNSNLSHFCENDPKIDSLISQSINISLLNRPYRLRDNFTLLPSRWIPFSEKYRSHYYIAPSRSTIIPTKFSVRRAVNCFGQISILSRTVFRSYCTSQLRSNWWHVPPPFRNLQPIRASLTIQFWVSLWWTIDIKHGD